MALVRLGGGVIQISGSIAGNTFARNRYGNYVRARTKPINPLSTRQQAIRNAIGAATARWGQTLTAAHRAAWNLYASSVAMKNKLGEVVYLSGFNHYIRCNAERLRAGFAAVDNASGIFELPTKDSTVAIAPDAGDQLLNVSFDNTMDWANETGGVLWMYQGRPQNPQRNFFAGPWRWVMCIGGDDATPPTSPDVAPCVFPISVLQHQWCYFRIQRADGRLSEPFRCDEFCTQ